MRTFVAFLKKELLDSVRSGKLLLLFILFSAFGIMNPAIAKLTPLLYEIFAEELAEGGMIITEVAVNALTSWTQFFKNIPMALIAFVLIYGGSFAHEYSSGTLVLLLTKGLPRYKVVLAKSTLLISLWSAGYWLCFLITYAYNALFWDNSIATGLAPAALNWWMFGILVTALLVFFSVVFRGLSAPLVTLSGSVVLMYAASFIPKASRFIPTSLMNSGAILTGVEPSGEYLPACIAAIVLSLAAIISSIPVFNKKQL